LPDKSYHNIIEILNDPCPGEISKSKIPGDLRKDVAMIEEKPVFGKVCSIITRIFIQDKTFSEIIAVISVRHVLK